MSFTDKNVAKKNYIAQQICDVFIYLFKQIDSIISLGEKMKSILNGKVNLIRMAHTGILLS